MKSRLKRYNNIKDPGLETISNSVLRKRIELPLLRRQLEYVIANSPFYRCKFRKMLTKRDSLYRNFDRLPFTYKKEIIDDQIKHPPFGSNLCVDPQQVLRVHKTSGTTNRPVIIAMTRSDINATVASGSRCFWASGLRPHHLIVHCLNYCMWMGGYTDHQSLEATGATVIPYGVGNSRALLDIMRDLKVNAIHCTPSYLAVLENLMRKELGIRPKTLGLKLGLFGGEAGVEDPAFRRHIESVWGFKAMNANYGAADLLSMFGAECHRQNGLHFMGQGNIIVELVDPSTDKVMPVEKGVVGELVITNIKRKAQPVIRFRARDMVRILGHNMCGCGRRSFRFNIIGRADDMIVVKGINIFPNQIKDRLARFLDRVSGHFQIILESPPVKRLKLKVEYRGRLNKKAKKNLAEFLEDDFKVKIGVKPSIALVSEGTLPRTYGKSEIIIRKYKREF